MTQHIIWYELEEAQADKPVEFLRAGTFTERKGRVVTITESDLDDYVANFEEQVTGQDVPIDINHKKDEAAGWVRKVWRDGIKLLASIEWNDVGRQLVGDQVYKYLSATINDSARILRSISLVNFPAVKGLAPVELSEGVMGLQAEPGLVERVLTAVKAAFDRPADIQFSAQDSAPSAQEATMIENEKPTLTPEQRAEVEAQVRAEMEAEMAEQEAELVEMRAKVRAELEAEMAEKAERRGKLREFAEEVCNGDAALSAKPEDVVDALEGLDDEQAERVQALLRSKVVDLSEKGTSREAGGKKQLPKRIIREVKEGNLTIADLSDPILDLGDLNDYDLSELTDKED